MRLALTHVASHRSQASSLAIESFGQWNANPFIVVLSHLITSKRLSIHVIWEATERESMVLHQSTMYSKGSDALALDLRRVIM